MKHSWLLALPVLFSFVFFAALPVQAADECVPVASVYGEEICEADITPDEETLAQINAYVAASGQNPDEALQNIRLSELFNKIWEKILIQKYGSKAIEPTQSEVDSYLKALRAAAKEQYQYDKETKELLTGLMKEKSYDADNQARLNRIGMEKDRAIMMYEMRDKVPAEMKAKIDESERDVAEAMIKNWKVKKLLYEEYGGRLIFQQTGLEPIDAFKALLDEVKRGDDVVVHDKKYNDVFKPMEEYIAMEHTEVPPEDKESKKYFESPTWLYESGVGADAQKQTLEIIKSIPVEGAAAPEEETEQTEEKAEEAAPE